MIKVKRIKYFSPDGQNRLPDGVYFQKGGFIHECQLNGLKFQLPGNNSMGAITILPNNITVENEEIREWFKKEFPLKMMESEIGLSLGNYFYGRYGTDFDARSICFAAHVDLRVALAISQKIVENFHLKNALVKDLKDGNVFLVEEER